MNRTVGLPGPLTMISAGVGVALMTLVGLWGLHLSDRSALQALSALDCLRPPPHEMARPIVVKFYPPSSG
jgi:hypothetical protein